MSGMLDGLRLDSILGGLGGAAGLGRLGQVIDSEGSLLSSGTEAFTGVSGASSQLGFVASVSAAASAALTTAVQKVISRDKQAGTDTDGDGDSAEPTMDVSGGDDSFTERKYRTPSSSSMDVNGGDDSFSESEDR
jgi:hypothetical protein